MPPMPWGIARNCPTASQASSGAGRGLSLLATLAEPRGEGGIKSGSPIPHIAIVLVADDRPERQLSVFGLRVRHREFLDGSSSVYLR